MTDTSPLPDPLHEAAREATRTASELLGILTAATRTHYELSHRRETAQRIAEEQSTRERQQAAQEERHAAREEQAAADRAVRDQREAAREAREALRDELRRAKAQFGPALDREYLAAAPIEDVMRAWTAAQEWAGEDADAARAMRLTEARLAEMHPDAIREYRAEVAAGAEPLDAMMRQIPRIQADLSDPTATAGQAAAARPAQERTSTEQARPAEREAEDRARTEDARPDQRDDEREQESPEERRRRRDELGDDTASARARLEDAQARSQEATLAAEAAAESGDDTAALLALRRAAEASGDTLAEVQRQVLDVVPAATPETAELVDAAGLARQRADEALASGAADAAELDRIAQAVERSAVGALAAERGHVPREPEPKQMPVPVNVSSEGLEASAAEIAARVLGQGPSQAPRP